MRVKDFLEDFNISYNDEFSSKNGSPDFLQMNCPFCDDHSDHLGIHITGKYSYCWRCKGHNIIKTIESLVGCTWKEAEEIHEQYMRGSEWIEEEETLPETKNETILVPGLKLDARHRRYLANRDFEVNYIERKFDLRGTMHYGDYKFRIIIPIYFNGQIVSYQGRDITNKQHLRYKACAKKNEIIHHKEILYNYDNCTNVNKHVMVVEGLFDVFRLGDDCVATFGTAFTDNQVKLLSKFKRVYTIYDAEDGAQESAEKIGFSIVCLWSGC